MIREERRAKGGSRAGTTGRSDGRYCTLCGSSRSLRVVSDWCYILYYELIARVQTLRNNFFKIISATALSCYSVGFTAGEVPGGGGVQKQGGGRGSFLTTGLNLKNSV